MIKQHTFRVGFIACGLGAGALGFCRSFASLGKSDAATFINVGGVDFDPRACEDFERITGGKATQADLHTMTPAELRAAWGDEPPDCVFMSPPCKGMSGLISNDMAATEKYQILNSLVFKSFFLLCETWPGKVPMLIFENVPRIVSRGAALLEQVRGLVRSYDYAVHEGTHKCEEIGGMGARRNRYLMICRQPSLVSSFVHRPPRQRIKACGEVLGTLPMPETESAGPLHRLPKLSWINWVRLALIPAGGDWRDLPKKGEPIRFGHVDKVTRWDETAGTITHAPAPSSGALAVADPRTADLFADALALDLTGDNAASFKGRPGLMGINDWESPARTINGSMQVSGGNGFAAVADPRVEAPPGVSRAGSYGVGKWDEPAKTITGESYPSNGSASVADPRIDVGERFKHCQKVTPWDEPVGTITAAGHPSNGAASVADPRIALDKQQPHRGAFGVTKWTEPAKTVRGAMNARQAPAAVADPRIPLSDKPNRHRNKYTVADWKEPAPTVIGSTRPGSGAPSVADPRTLALDLGDGAHNNLYRVEEWEQPAGTITGATRPGGGAPSVADPRGLPPELLTPLEDGQARRALFRRWHINEWSQPAGVVSGDGGNNGAFGVADPMERIPVACAPRNGAYGVVSWEEAAYTVTGAACIDNGPFAVGDPRVAGLRLVNDEYPIIISADGTWHRPLTTLELAVLQGLPATYDDGTPLVLAGKSMSSKRERIGNAVPVGAAQAVGESILIALLASKLGTWSLSSEGVWVDHETGKTEYEFAYLGDAA